VRGWGEKKELLTIGKEGGTLGPERGKRGLLCSHHVGGGLSGLLEEKKKDPEEGKKVDRRRGKNPRSSKKLESRKYNWILQREGRTGQTCITKATREKFRVIRHKKRGPNLQESNEPRL